MLTDVWIRIRSLFRRQAVEGELDDELGFHFEQQIEKYVRLGMGREEARRRAQIEFGGLDQVKEECRDARGVRLLETLAQDTRYSLRMLRRSPAFTGVAVLTLALGIGANTAIFSIVNGVVLRALPYARPDHLVGITDSYPEGALVRMQQGLGSLEVAGYSDGQELNLTGLGDPVRLYGTAVSANFFSLLGVDAATGRTFLPGEDHPGKDGVVILSHALWRQKFGGEPNVIGRRVTFEGKSREIVGVMPDTFYFASSKAQFWIPLDLDSRDIGAYWGGGFMPLIGRLRAGITLGQARAELKANVPRIRGMFPWRMPDSLWAASTIVPLETSLVGDVAEKFGILLAATGLVLLVACVNVANLYMARASVREREICVRSTLGAGRWRILRQLLTESIVLGLAGGGLGLLLGVKALPWLESILPADTPRLASVSIDWRVMAFGAVVTIVTGIGFGIAPALHLSRAGLSASLNTGRQHSVSRIARRVGNALVVTEVALAVVLVVGAGLMVKSLWKLAHVDPGFRPESLLTARITPNRTFCADFARCRTFYDALSQRARAIPGVLDVALTKVLPLDGRMSAFAAGFEDHAQDPRDPAPVLWESVITPGYLRTMRIPLLGGRAFTDADTRADSPPVVLITAATARKFWPHQNPVGKHLKRVWASDWATVVGVVGDTNEYTLAARLPDYIDGAVYEPFGNAVNAAARLSMVQPTEMTLVVRLASARVNIVEPLRKTVRSLDRAVPLSRIRTYQAVVSESESAWRSTTLLFSIFAALALLLGAIGIYGVVSYSVAQRTSEIGLRVALGAEPGRVMQVVVGQGVRLALVGVVIGTLAAFAATQVMSTLLYEVTPRDPFTFAVVGILFVLVAVLACGVPARRAMRVDPIVALRYE
ncbi:MAG TPA: ABC transporter permease [Candidatus Cybelea sp.]|nr:ABC transporter permease [Candidatus Cybelea sp.]